VRIAIFSDRCKRFLLGLPKAAGVEAGAGVLGGGGGGAAWVGSICVYVSVPCFLVLWRCAREHTTTPCGDPWGSAALALLRVWVRGLGWGDVWGAMLAPGLLCVSIMHVIALIHSSFFPSRPTANVLPSTRGGVGAAAERLGPSCPGGAANGRRGAHRGHPRGMGTHAPALPNGGAPLRDPDTGAGRRPSATPVEPARGEQGREGRLARLASYPLPRGQLGRIATAEAEEWAHAFAQAARYERQRPSREAFSHATAGTRDADERCEFGS
jgi:hypothetical protein